MENINFGKQEKDQPRWQYIRDLCLIGEGKGNYKIRQKAFELLDRETITPQELYDELSDITLGFDIDFISDLKYKYSRYLNQINKTKQPYTKELELKKKNQSIDLAISASSSLILAYIVSLLGFENNDIYDWPSGMYAYLAMLNLYRISQITQTKQKISDIQKLEELYDS